MNIGLVKLLKLRLGAKTLEHEQAAEVASSERPNVKSLTAQKLRRAQGKRHLLADLPPNVAMCRNSGQPCMKYKRLMS